MLEGHRNSQVSHDSHKKVKGPLYIDDPLRLGEKIQVSDLCPSCHSIYVTKGHCESCGLQFGIDVVGEPFGPRSFFTLKDDFDLTLNKFDYLEWHLTPQIFVKKSEVQRFVRHMLKRFTDLTAYLASLDLIMIPENKDDHIRLFIFEAKEIMKEYQKFSTDLSALFVSLKKFSPDAGDLDAATKVLLDFLYDLDSEKKSSADELSHEVKAINISHWEMLRRGIVLEALATIGAVTLASFLIMKYLSN